MWATIDSMKKIITTVGTSIFTNYRKEKVKNHYGRNYASIGVPYDRTEDEPASSIYDDNFRSYVRSLKEVIEDYWYEYDGRANQTVSAEISSILKIAEAENEPCEVHLIATDTLQSVLAAELMVGWFERFPQPKVSKVLFQRQGTAFEMQKDSDYVVKDLRVESHKDYEKGFFNLLELLDKLSKAGKKEEYELVFNVTGGYKALIPVMTLYAQLERIPLKYLYESHEGKEDPLISLSNLPFHFDWGLLELLADYIEDKELRINLADDSPILHLLRKYKIVKSETKDLSIIGSMVEKFVNHRLWEGKTSLGYFAEYKVLEALIEQFDERPKRGVEYWWDKQNSSQYAELPQHDKEADKEVRIEFDLVSEINGKQIWYEVKPFSKSGLTKAYNQAKQKLDFQKIALNAPLEKFRLVLYKFDFEAVKKSQQFTNLEKVFKDAGVEYEVWCFDVPVNMDAEKTENKSFFEQKIELKKLEI